MYAWVWTQIFSNGWHKPFSRLHLGIEKFTQWKGHKSKEKNVSTETRQNSRAVWGARLKKILSREFWYTRVCVGPNPTPVRKRFEHDEAEPSADKFCHTGTLIEDDSPEQKTKKISTSSLADTPAVHKCTKKKIISRDMWNTNVPVGLNANLFKLMTQTV